LLKKIKSLEYKYISMLSNGVESTPDKEECAPPELCETTNNIIVEMKKPFRQKDGFYHVGNNLYKTLVGSRQEVWDGVSYKTTGGLIKSDLIMNHDGKIVSLCKSVTEKKIYRFEQVNLLKAIKNQLV
jgi:hypothetical protein